MSNKNPGNDSYPEYIKKSFKSIEKEPIKNGQKIWTLYQKTKTGNYQHEQMLYILSHQWKANYYYNEKAKILNADHTKCWQGDGTIETFIWHWCVCEVVGPLSGISGFRLWYIQLH